MARLRIYRQNKGNMLELVRFQKREMPKVAGAEEMVYSAAEIAKSERNVKSKLGMYADIPVYSIPYQQIKKKLAIRDQIWGL